jgi:hypothetical protein
MIAGSRATIRLSEVMSCHSSAKAYVPEDGQTKGRHHLVVLGELLCQKMVLSSEGFELIRSTW